MSDTFERYANKPEVAPILGIIARKQVRSRKKLQKLAYFLQEGEGVPLGLEFRMYHYGPYSERLDSRLLQLEALGLVDVSRDETDVPTYDISAEVSETDEEATRPIDVERVVRTFGGKSPIDLELLSTVHFLSTHHPPEDDDQLFSRLQAWKGPKFRRKQMESAVDELRELGYLA